MRRLDRKLLSLLIITYGLQYYDKAMLSQAVRQGLSGSNALADQIRPSSDCEQTLVLQRAIGILCQPLSSTWALSSAATQPS